MRKVFISFAARNIDNPISRDAIVASYLSDWLTSEGVEPFRFDRPSLGLPDQDWPSNLEHEVKDSDAMVVVLSAHWLNSGVCQTEFNIAVEAHRPIFVIRHEWLEYPKPIAGPLARLQQYDLSRLGERTIHRIEYQDKLYALQISTEILSELRFRLFDVKAGIVRPPWPDERPDILAISNRDKYQNANRPVAGLDPLYEWQGGVYFGRDPKIETFINRLKGARFDRAHNRAIPILGASGVGKSSFLRAGIVSRLVSQPGFVTLPVIRPKAGIDTDRNEDITAILNNWMSQIPGLDPKIPHPNAIAKLKGHELSRMIARIADLIHQKKYQRPAEAIIIPVDQAEELFFFSRLSSSGQSLSDWTKRTIINGDDVLRFIKDLHSADERFISIFTVRADYENDFFQAQIVPPTAVGTPEHLAPIGPSEYPQLIEGPFKHYPNIRMEPSLVRQLANQAKDYRGEGDVLPLLAIIIEDIWNHVKDKVHSAEPFQLSGKSLWGASDDSAPSVQKAISRLVARAVKMTRLGEHSGTRREDASEDQIIDLLLGRFIYFDENAREARRAIVRVAGLDENNPADLNDKSLIEDLANSRLLRVVHDETDTTSGPSGTPRILTAEIIHDLILTEWGTLSSAIQRRAGVLASKGHFEALYERKRASSGGNEGMLGLDDIQRARLYRDLDPLWTRLTPGVRTFLDAEIKRYEEVEQRQKQNEIELRTDRDNLRGELTTLRVEHTNKQLSANQEISLLKNAKKDWKTRALWSTVIAIVGVLGLGTFLFNQIDTSSRDRQAAALRIDSFETLDALRWDRKDGTDRAINWLDQSFEADPSGEVSRIQGPRDDIVRQLVSRPVVEQEFDAACSPSNGQQARISSIGFAVGCEDRMYWWSNASSSTLSTLEDVKVSTMEIGEAGIFFTTRNSSQVSVALPGGEKAGIFQHNGPVTAISANAGGERLVSTSTDYEVRLFDQHNGNWRSRKFGPLGARGKWVELLEGDFVVAGDESGSVYVWKSEPESGAMGLDKAFQPRGLEEGVSFVNYFGETGELLFADSSGRISAVDGESFSPAGVVERHVVPIVDVIWMQDAKAYFSIDEAGFAALWKLDGSLRDEPVSLGVLPVGRLAHLPGSRIWAGIDKGGRGFLLELGSDNVVRLLNTFTPTNGARLKSVTPSADGLRWLGIMPDGRSITTLKSALGDKFENKKNLCDRYKDNLKLDDYCGRSLPIAP